jgi:hypothetical protein
MAETLGESHGTGRLSFTGREDDIEAGLDESNSTLRSTAATPLLSSAATPSLQLDDNDDFPTETQAE